MFDIALYRPQIPPNTGNIMRLCANTGSRLHLIGPVAFDLDDARVRRAGLDYRDRSVLIRHDEWSAARAALSGRRWWVFSGRGTASHADVAYRPGDVLLFGPERDGLPPDVLDEFPPAAVLRIPMVPDSRSLNLSNAVAVVVYEAWRQQRFNGAT